MQTIDNISYHCGVIDCFNEMIQVEVKQLALSHPIDTIDEGQELLPHIQRICDAYGTQYYFEESLLNSSLFILKQPVSVYLFYKDERILHEYLKLKQLVQSYEQQHQYTSERQREVAIAFAQLLSYPKHIYEAMIAKNIKIDETYEKHARIS